MSTVVVFDASDFVRSTTDETSAIPRISFVVLSVLSLFANAARLLV